MKFFFKKNTKMYEVKAALQRTFGKRIFFYAVKMDWTFDYCFEEGIGEIEKSYELSFTELNEEII